uniref:DNA-3-methyladenine glycosylase 2 family protein n=1 Tax=Ningiella ruwaisensis TaxID=2364274 RepID=UPI0014454B36|nr:Ada metal-binding domain-containing protein [Ningiella ruwaisensis]
MLTIQECQKARLSRDPRFDGKFFILVKSTGIFCRPVCKVKAPLEKNVEYSPSAIDAMQRGYRPCLRCRPDAAPHSFAWKGVSTSVQRAVHLLTTCLQQDVSTIAARMGISSRYLHKLMQENLQIAPKRFRLLHQILLAKRLLQGSNMSVEQVAQGAGFSSARQLQTHIKKEMGLSCSQIRQAGKNEHPVTTPETRLFLSYIGEYDWPLIRDFFAKRAVHQNERVLQSSIKKVFWIENTPIAVEMEYCADEKGFEISFDCKHLLHTQAIIDHANTMLDLSANSYVISDALLSAGLQAAEINSGIRIPGINDKFEAGVRAILGQQVSVAAAINKLNQFQDALTNDSGAFVRPEQVLKSDLAFLKMPNARKEALKNFAQMMSEDPNANFEKWLDIKGIGPWTVNYVRLRANRETDVFLDSDLIIKQRIAAFESAGRNLDHKAAAPWRSYLTLSLWNLPKAL